VFGSIVEWFKFSFKSLYPGTVHNIKQAVYRNCYNDDGTLKVDVQKGFVLPEVVTRKLPPEERSYPATPLTPEKRMNLYRSLIHIGMTLYESIPQDDDRDIRDLTSQQTDRRIQRAIDTICSNRDAYKMLPLNEQKEFLKYIEPCVNLITTYQRDDE